MFRCTRNPQVPPRRFHPRYIETPQHSTHSKVTLQNVHFVALKCKFSLAKCPFRGPEMQIFFG
jgi:hypothetical protein